MSASAQREDPRDPTPTVRLVVLIGFMASGKTTVGRVLAHALRWRFIDADLEIEARTGRSIEEWFRDSGETAFRAMEAELTTTLLSEDHAVLALGGGWAAQPGAFEAVPPGARTIWLRVSAAEALRRVAADPVVRPLLAGGADGEVARALLREREAAYRRADFAVDVDGRTPEQITRNILDVLGIE